MMLPSKDDVISSVRRAKDQWEQNFAVDDDIITVYKNGLKAQRL